MQIFCYMLRLFATYPCSWRIVCFYSRPKKDTKSHWVNPFPIIKHKYVRVFEKKCVKTIFVMRFIQRDIMDHFCQEWQPILLYCSQCFPVIFVFGLWFVDIFIFKLYVYSRSSVVLNPFYPFNLILYLIIIHLYKFERYLYCNSGLC